MKFFIIYYSLTSQRVSGCLLLLLLSLLSTMIATIDSQGESVETLLILRLWVSFRTRRPHCWSGCLCHAGHLSFSCRLITPVSHPASLVPSRRMALPEQSCVRRGR